MDHTNPIISYLAFTPLDQILADRQKYIAEFANAQKVELIPITKVVTMSHTALKTYLKAAERK
jgi:hypothetical protein